MPTAAARRLTERGQRLCPVADDEMPLIEQSVLRTLTATGLRPAAVRQVLIATETLGASGSRDGHEWTRGRLYRTLAGLGLGHAPVTAFSFGGCGTVMTALEYAGLVAERDPSATSLVIAVGRMREGDSRVLAPAVSAIGDGAASCVVRAGGAGWRTRWLLRRAFLDVAAFDRTKEDFGPSLLLLGRALRGLLHEAREQGLPEKPVLLCNNYGLPTLQMFAGALRATADQLFTDNVARLSHLGTPDLLINLADLPAATSTVLVLATGPADCALALLERTEGDPA
ncbi:hypothetical protein N566_04755 [Streptomycetaceae bacterium MP113-05]|nr:hypothetical protein N566_04755 [Streptomycetaceae bacterium MP113-05]